MLGAVTGCDRLGAAVVRTLPVSGSMAVASPPVEPGVWFWRVRARAGMSASGQAQRSDGNVVVSRTWRAPNSSDLAFEQTLGAAGDVNGDGDVDLIVCGFASASDRGAGCVYQWIRGLPAGTFSRTPVGIPAPESGPVGFGRAIAQ